MTTNLDVTVRLNDQLSRQAKAPTEALERFAALTKRFTGSTANGATRNIRGIMTSLHGLDRATPSTTGTINLGRFADAVGRLAGRADGLRATSAAMNGLGRSVARLGGLATKAEAAAKGVERLRGVLSTMPAGESFAERQNAALRDMIGLQKRALAGATALGRAGGGGGNGHGGRRALVGFDGHGPLRGIISNFQPSGHETLKGIYEQATSLQDAIVKMHLNGLSDSDIARVRLKAEEVAHFNKSTNPLTNINAIMEARLALGGDLDEAIVTAQEVSKLRTIVGFTLGKDRAKGAEDGVYDALRTAEVRNVVNDPARRDDLFRGITAALIASNGRITPKQWHANVIHGRSATQGLSDRFQNYRAPFLYQELSGGRGGQAGTALQALFRAIPLATQKLSNIGEWRKLGFVDESKVDKDDKGHDKAIHPGAITLGPTAITDPDKAVYLLMDAMKAHGITERGAIIQEFAQLVGTGTGQAAVDILGLQRSRMDNFERTLRQVEDTNTLFAQINATASQSVANLDAQLDALKGNIGSSVIPVFTSMVDAATRFVGITNNAAGVVGKNGDDPTRMGNGYGGKVGALAGAGTLYGFSKLAVRFPWLARGMAAGAGGLYGGPLGALLGPTILEAGKKAGGLAMRYGGAAVGAAAAETPLGPILAMKTLQDRYEASAEGMRARAEKLSALASIGAGLLADGKSPLRPGLQPLSGAPYEVPLAGRRALGGPVDRQKSYLVGERGPEIFTPGVHGGITSNRMLNGLANAGAAGDGDTPKAIGYLSFRLASAVGEIARAVDRLRDRYAFAGMDGGSFAGGGTVAHGGGGGGRRGFMGRMGGGHYGGRAGMGGGGDGVALSKDQTGFAGAYKDNPAIRAYIVASAKARGIDPAVALKVWGHEGHAGYVGDGNSSFGPFQLHYGNVNPAMPHAGIGDDFTKATGLDARDPTTIRQQIDFAMNHVRRKGWGAWMGAAAEGIHGFRGVGPMPAGSASGVSSDRSPIGGVGRAGAAASIVDRAQGMLGASAGQAAAALGKRMTPGAWCADFVNGALATGGIKGTGSSAASSFTRFGRAVAGNALRRGDIVVENHHVGIATGERDAQGRIGMISGNYSHKVSRSWERLDKILAFRRANEASQGPQDHVPEALREQAKQKREAADQQARNQATGGDTHHHYHGDISIPVHAQPDHNPRQIASAVHDNFNRAVNSQLSDGAFA